MPLSLSILRTFSCPPAYATAQLLLRWSVNDTLWGRTAFTLPSPYTRAPARGAQASLRPLARWSAAAPAPASISAALASAPCAGAAASPAGAEQPAAVAWTPAVEPRDAYRTPPDFFAYARPAPPGFERWLAYARPRQCVLGRYDRLEADLAPFRDPGSPARRTITRAALAAATALPHTVLFHVRAGNVSFDAAPVLAPIAREYLTVLDRIAPFLPDTDFVLNTLDTPRARRARRPASKVARALSSPGLVMCIISRFCAVGFRCGACSSTLVRALSFTVMVMPWLSSMTASPRGIAWPGRGRSLDGGARRGRCCRARARSRSGWRRRAPTRRPS